MSPKTAFIHFICLSFGLIIIANSCVTTNEKLTLENLIELFDIHNKMAGYWELAIIYNSWEKESGKPNEWLSKIKLSQQPYSVQMGNLTEFLSNLELEFEHIDERPQEEQLFMLIIPPNTSSFLSSLKMIVDQEADHHKINPLGENYSQYQRHWTPKFFLQWPEIINTANLDKEVVLGLLNSNTSSLGSIIANISIMDEIYIIIQSSSAAAAAAATNSTNLTLWGIYSIGEIQFCQPIPLISDEYCQLDWLQFNDKINRRKDFGGASIWAIAPNDSVFEPEAKFDPLTTAEDARFESGTSVSMFRYLRDGLNFTEIAKVGEWITDVNGEIGGDAKHIMEGEADIAIEQTVMSSTRKQRVHFLHPTYFDGMQAFFVQPPISTSRNLYIAPFKVDLWLTFISSWFLLIISMKMCAWIKSLVVEKSPRKDSEVIADVYLWTIGAVCQQGWHVQPVSASLRIIFITGYIMGLVCFVAFSAAIVSLLSVKVVPMKTIDDLRDNSFHFYANPNSTTLDGMDHLLEKQAGAGTIVEEKYAIKQLTETKSALLTYPDIFYSELYNQTELNLKGKYQSSTEEKICEMFYYVPVSSNPIRMGMMVNKKSPFIEFFNYQILLMRERGLNLRYLRQYWSQTEVACLLQTSGFKQELGILDVITALYILLTGHVLSLLFLFIEILLRNFKLVYQVKT